MKLLFLAIIAFTSVSQADVTAESFVAARMLLKSAVDQNLFLKAMNMSSFQSVGNIHEFDARMRKAASEGHINSFKCIGGGHLVECRLEISTSMYLGEPYHYNKTFTDIIFIYYNIAKNQASSVLDKPL